MTLNDDTDDLKDTGGRAVAIAVQAVRRILAEEERKRAERDAAILKAIQEVKTDTAQVRQMKEEERTARNKIKAALNRIWRAIVAAVGDLEK